MTKTIHQIQGEIDSLTRKIVFELGERLYLPSNQTVYRQKIDGEGTLLEKRLFLDRSKDDLFERSIFENKPRLSTNGSSLPASLFKRKVEHNISQLELGMDREVLEFYFSNVLTMLPDEDLPDTYGETVKIDSKIIRDINHRVCCLGPYVAVAKIDKNPEVMKLESAEDIRKAFVNSTREAEVIADACKFAEKYGIENPRIIGPIFRGIIDLTLEAEVRYVQQLQKQL